MLCSHDLRVAAFSIWVLLVCKHWRERMESLSHVVILCRNRHTGEGEGREGRCSIVATDHNIQTGHSHASNSWADITREDLKTLHLIPPPVCLLDSRTSLCVISWSFPTYMCLYVPLTMPKKTTIKTILKKYPISVLTRIYRPKGTNNISWPHPSSWT